MPFIKTSDRILIHYKTKGNGDSIVFLHGFGSCVDDWGYQTTSFRLKYQTITIDMRGHGKSGKPYPLKKEYSIKRMAKDVIEVLNHLNVKTAHFVGLSMGGCVSVQIGLDFPDQTNSLTLVNTPVFGGGRKTIFQTQLNLRLFIVRKFGVDLMASLIAYRLFPKRHQSDLRKLAKKRIGENPRWSYYASIYAIANMKVENRLDELRCKTLIIVGENDKIVHPTLNKTLVKRLNKVSTLNKMKKAGHAAPLDSPEEFNQVLYNWLNKQNNY